MLAEEGYDVVGEAGDGEQAVERATELRPDLVILDVKMPVLDGIRRAEQIAGARIAPVIMLTAFSQRELVERARDAGAMAYLVKPFSKNDLVPAIEMARGRFAEMTALEGEVATSRSASRPARRSTGPRACCRSELGLTEPEAFRWIQKTAMDLRRRCAKSPTASRARSRRRPTVSTGSASRCLRSERTRICASARHGDHETVTKPDRTGTGSAWCLLFASRHRRNSQRSRRADRAARRPATGGHVRLHARSRYGPPLLAAAGAGADRLRHDGRRQRRGLGQRRRASTCVQRRVGFLGAADRCRGPSAITWATASSLPSTSTTRRTPTARSA